jgi:hypothetical protein
MFRLLERWQNAQIGKEILYRSEYRCTVINTGRVKSNTTLNLNLPAPTTVGARINPYATNVTYIYDISSLKVNDLTLILLTWRKW